MREHTLAPLARAALKMQSQRKQVYQYLYGKIIDGEAHYTTEWADESPGRYGWEFVAGPVPTHT